MDEEFNRGYPMKTWQNRYEITDTVDGRTLLIIPRVSTRRLAKRVAIKFAETYPGRITLHELGRYGARTFLEIYESRAS